LQLGDDLDAISKTVKTNGKTGPTKRPCPPPGREGFGKVAMSWSLSG
jgi:hypothetical protein